MKHTPGPWVVKRESGLRQRIQTAGDKGTLCYMTARPFAHSGNFSHEQITDNARLIAAAPDLLAACERMARAFEQHSYPELQGIASDVFAAIAKATS